MKKCKLTLYVTGRTARSQTAIHNLQPILRKNFGEQFELAVVDVLEHPDMAEEKRILATPTLIREFPTPVRRIIGDMSVTDKVLVGLDLLPLAESG